MLAAVLAVAAAGITSPVGPLPLEWAGDFGVPVAWQDTTVWLYADIHTADGRFARNAVVIDGEMLVQPLDRPDGFYWPTDAVELPDGSLLVVALEGKNRPDMANDGWAFEITDTDAFVVRDPRSAKSWELAQFNVIDDGPWDLRQVEFLDTGNYVAARDVYGDGGTTIYSYDPGHPEAWEYVTDETPSSDGPFAPVATDAGWFGYSWDWEQNTATLWTTTELGEPWVEVGTIQPAGQTHAHGLNVIDGTVVHRWSVFRERPQYELEGFAS